MDHNKQKIATYLGVLVVVALLTGLIFTAVSNSKGRKRLNAEKQTSEKLLSEKLSTEKELAKVKVDYTSLKQKSEQNERLLDEVNGRISEGEKKIISLSAENRNLRSAKKELEDLKKVKTDLEEQSSRLKSDYDRLVAQNTNLQNSLNEMERKYLALQQENERKINSDNFLVTATRGKKAERIVIRAARAKKLNMAFEVPNNVSESMSFTLTTPSGSVINPDNKSLTWSFPEESNNYTASLSWVSGTFEPSKKVVLNYTPDKKLEKGEYKIQILCGNKNIGNCRIYLK